MLAIKWQTVVAIDREVPHGVVGSVLKGSGI